MYGQSPQSKMKTTPSGRLISSRVPFTQKFRYARETQVRILLNRVVNKINQPGGGGGRGLGEGTVFGLTGNWTAPARLSLGQVPLYMDNDKTEAASAKENFSLEKAEKVKRKKSTFFGKITNQEEGGMGRDRGSANETSTS